MSSYISNRSEAGLCRHQTAIEPIFQNESTIVLTFSITLCEDNTQESTASSCAASLTMDQLACCFCFPVSNQKLTSVTQNSFLIFVSNIPMLLSLCPNPTVKCLWTWPNLQSIHPSSHRTPAVYCVWFPGPKDRRPWEQQHTHKYRHIDGWLGVRTEMAYRSA